MVIYCNFLWQGSCGLGAEESAGLNLNEAQSEGGVDDATRNLAILHFHCTCTVKISLQQSVTVPATCICIGSRIALRKKHFHLNIHVSTNPSRKRLKSEGKPGKGK